MARLPRLYAPGLTQLVMVDFVKSSDGTPLPLTNVILKDMVRWLGEASETRQVSIHGWVVTPLSFALLATPADPGGISKMIQTLGRNLAAHLKSGPVFNGRFHSTLLEPGVWVLPALIWLEWLPVRSGLTQDPELWPWSSAALHAGLDGLNPSWLEDHVDYWACGNTPFDRQANYRAKLQNGIPSSVQEKIHTSLRGQWALGSEAFLSELTGIASRRAKPGARGRPKKLTKSVP